jgi:hypothetical protein
VKERIMSTWQEVVIEGPERTARAFVAGFLAGRRGSGGVFARDLPLEPASLGERLKALFLAGSHDVFLAPEAVAAALADALEQRGRDVGLRLERRRTIVSIQFMFRAEVFSRDVAAEIRRELLDAIPPGARVEGLSEAEEIHPEARGPEPFAPLHSYVYRVSGRIVGSVEDVLPLWERIHTRDFIRICDFRVVAR